jgi:hypothetical protein
MPVISENKYLQSLLENLIATYETEINYTPLDIELDPQQISKKDIPTLLNFVKEARKRLFIFKIPHDELNTTTLGLTARRSVLNQGAETILKNTSAEPKINPLKLALNNPTSTVRVGIQIQKSFVIPSQPLLIKKRQNSLGEQITTPDLVLIPINLPDFPALTKQLKALGIDKIHGAAALKIKEHPHAFTDGIIPGNLPKGFYIDNTTLALCYTTTPRRLPTALAPTLENLVLITMPSVEQAQAILPATITTKTITQLLNSRNPRNQKNALINVLATYSGEMNSFLQLLKPTQLEFIVPTLAKMFILGGEAHTSLLIRLLTTCINKKISLEFLQSPGAQDAFLSPRGIKNLQKLLQLPAEQKEWWNTLVLAHLKNSQHHFDFNTFFEAYTQNFLQPIAEKNLTLPQPCPIIHNGHLLITLNRVLEVLDRAQNLQEQCLSLANLNWGPTGVHYAMTHNRPNLEKMKQVSACMQLENPEDALASPELIHAQIEDEKLDLKPWLFRYIGQYWKESIRLTDIQAQLEEIQKLSTWSSVQKNQLIFILTCTFSEKTDLTAEQWKKTLSNCINLLQSLNTADRGDLLQTLSRCFQFKPIPSLAQMELLVRQCIELKKTFPDKNFKNELLIPLISCLENEGFELYKTLQDRVQKTEITPNDNKLSLSAINSFTAILEKNRHNMHPDIIKLLAKLNEPQLTQNSIESLLASFKNLEAKKDNAYYHLVLSTLSQVNISKSNPLPNIQQIQNLLNALADSPTSIPPECKTIDKQETWLKDLIFDKNLLPGCVLGNGDISKLDDLLVDALVDAVKKRSAALDVRELKDSLQGNIQSSLVPQQLRDQINAELIPVFDAVNELVTLLQTPSPKFPEVLQKLKYFEEKKPALLSGVYSVGPLGTAKGEDLVSILLTGKRKITDKTTGTIFAGILGQVHNRILKQINDFFNNEQNKIRVKDLDAKTSLSWMASFNETHALTFFFKEELVHKKVVPALKKTLQQLNTNDPIFEKSILDSAAEIAENEPSDVALDGYKNKIESIAQYLNLLIDIKDQKPAQFYAIYKQLNSGALSRINYSQKQVLISELLKAKPESLDLYLKLITQALDETPEADAIAIDRAIHGLVALFKLSDLESETQLMFFTMSMRHNLKSPSPFPLSALNEFKKSTLAEPTKSIIIKQIIHILSRMELMDSPEFIHTLVQQTQTFLTINPDLAPLCIALLKRVSVTEYNHDLSSYPDILSQLTVLNAENKEKLATVLTSLANNNRDDSVNLTSLLEITKGLGRRSSADIKQVLQLFALPPYPTTQNLNSALMAHDSTKLRAYCLNFDKNPFANRRGERDLATQFATDRIKEALINLKDLLTEEEFPHLLQLQLARQLTYIETLGYTDPLNPNDYRSLKKLTLLSRYDLKERASTLLLQLRSKTLLPEQIELTQLELLAYMREIYFRTTGLFPNSTQMLVLLLSLRDPTTNILLRIKPGQGKSINAPMLSVLQWTQGGTVDQFTANPTLLNRDYENYCEPFFSFLGIKSTVIQGSSNPEVYQLNGINCSTTEDMSIFRLTAKESNKEALIQNDGPIHTVLDECHDALLDQNTLYKLVAAQTLSEAKEIKPAQWIYPLAYQFINLPAFRNINFSLGKVWDDEEDVEQFRLFLNKEISGDIEKQNFLMAATKTQLMQWINASCKAASLVENKDFIVQPLKIKDETGNESTNLNVCVPLVRSTPKKGSIFTGGVQQALQARLNAQRKDNASYFVIDADPPVLASQSAQGLIRFYQKTKGRLVGISGTPGDQLDLKNLATLFGTQAIGVAPHEGDSRINHPPIFTFTREATFNAIHNAIDNIKVPVTKPTMEINTDTAFQTYEEREALIDVTKQAVEQWSYTQTQPIILFNESFDYSKNLGQSFNKYKKLGFKVQIVTGKETPLEINRIIKQAGQVNTITVSTAMLALGIDIKTDHPKGLFVIQTYADTESMTTQIGGRTARNGKPGELLPIYQIKPPQTFVEKLLYYIFPWYRQSTNEHAVAKLKNQIKLQSTIDRLYTQAIDEAQQTLMYQIHAWESFLLELYPNDIKLRHELYQWRETVLSELNRLQETSITQQTLEANITQFKNSASNLWQNLREEKWVAKAQKAPTMTTDQSLRFSYLNQLDLAQEFNIQLALQQKSKPFTAGTKALMDQNLETMITDKAGAVLSYTTPSQEEKNTLELAQSKLLLPQLVGEFCAIYPPAINTLFPKNKTQTSRYLPEIINKLVNKVIEQKNRILLGDEERQQISQTIIEYYQKELLQADHSKIQVLLEQIKPLILAHSEILTKSSLVDQFKMQGLVLTFSTLYQHSGLAEDPQLTTLKTNYHDEIMKKLAEHLLEEFAWVKKSPPPLHAFLERPVAKEAAFLLCDLAEEVKNAPKDEARIHALYKGLQQHRVILQDKYLFSLRHRSPRQVINEALAALDSLKVAPQHCTPEFRNECHDSVLSEYHLNQFRDYLDHISTHFNTQEEPVWAHLIKTLTEMSQKNETNQSYVIQELMEAVERFKTYEAYQPYLKQLKAIGKQLTQSMEVLKQADGLKLDAQELLLNQKTEHFAQLFNVNKEQVRIQNGTDGLRSYIEVQVENAPLKEGFTGFQSSFFANLENEKGRLNLKSTTLQANQEALINLSNAKAIETLPPEKQAAFEQLFTLKKLLILDWVQDLDSLSSNDLPQLIQTKLGLIKQLNQWSWIKDPVDLKELRTILGKDPDPTFTEVLKQQTTLNAKLVEIQSRLSTANQQLSDQKNKVLTEEQSIIRMQKRIQEPDCGFMERASLKIQILASRGKLVYFQRNLSGPENQLARVNKEETDCQEEIKQLNQSLDMNRIEFVATLLDQTKQTLDKHLHQSSKTLFEEMQTEVQTIDDSIATIKIAEVKKSRYQTRRFFNPSELLSYEAKLAHEKEKIPTKQDLPAKGTIPESGVEQASVLNGGYALG